MSPWRLILLFKFLNFMKKIIYLLGLLSLPLVASAQWAVYDKKIHDEIKKINKVNALTNQEIIKLDNAFKNEFSESTGTNNSTSNPAAGLNQNQSNSGNAVPGANSGQPPITNSSGAGAPTQQSTGSSQNSANINIGTGDNLVTLRGLKSKFHEINPADLNEYIDSEVECGDENNKKHYSACLGLRNIRLQTIKQSHLMLKNIDARRKQIVKLIEASRQLNGDDVASGVMQRYHFELQGLQSLMQADTMQLQVLMDGYKYREAIYQTQMNEARKRSDTNSRAQNKLPFIAF